MSNSWQLLFFATILLSSISIFPIFGNIIPANGEKNPMCSDQSSNSTITYAWQAKVYNIPTVFYKEEPVQYITLGYLFSKEPIRNFVAIFQIKDSEGIVHQIFSIPINASNSWTLPYLDNVSPPVRGVELDTKYLNEVKIQKVGNYTLEVYTWNCLQDGIPFADPIKYNFRVLQRTNEVVTGDIVLDIKTPSQFVPQHYNATVTLNAINFGNNDLTITNNENKNPLNINLYVNKNGSYVPAEPNSTSCKTYDEENGKNVSASGGILSLKAKSSIVLECEYKFIPPSNKSWVPAIQLMASGSLTGKLEPWDQTKYGDEKTPGIINLLTDPIVFAKELIEFIPPS